MVPVLFTVSSTYCVAANIGYESKDPFWQLPWKKVPNRICAFIWLVKHGRIMCNAKRMSDTPIRHPVSKKDVTNLKTINLLTYKILNNYLEIINLQKKFHIQPP